MNDDDKLLIAAIEQHEASAETAGTLQDERTDALDYYLGKPLGNEVDGRSQVIYRSVFDTVEWIKPQLADIFTSGEDIVSFSPRGPEDVKGAEQETDYTNHIITDRNPWFDIFLAWSHDALVQKVGYVKAFWDDSTDTVSERYENLTDDEFALLMQDEDIEVVEHEEKLQSFDPQGMFVVKTHTVRVERNKPENVVRIENVAPGYVRVSKNARGLSLQDRRLDFVEHYERKTISALREEGFDVPDDISDAGDHSASWEEELRDENNLMRDIDDIEADPSMRQVWVREVWIRHDKNGDGRAELLHVIVVGKTVLLCEETDHVGLVALCPTPLSHQHYGLSIADAVMDLQRIQTAMLRQALDNQYLANNGRYGINTNNVNLDDMLDSRAGGVVRVDGDPNANIAPLTHPTNGTQAIPMLEYVDKIAQRRTGVSEMSQGLDPNALNNQAGANANTQMMTAAQQRIRFIAKVFAETGVKCLFQLVHMLSLKHSRQTELVQLRGEWVPVNPRQWVKRKDMKVTLTLGTGDKPQQIMMLQQIGLAQKEGLAIGIAKPKNLYNTAVKITKLMGHKSAEDFWTDPGDAPMQPPPDPKIAVAQMQLQADAQKFQAEAQLKREIESINISAKQRESELQLQLQASNDMRDSEREALKAQYEQERAMLDIQTKERIKAAELEHDRWKTEYQAGVQLQTAQMSAQTTMQTASLSAEKDMALAQHNAAQKAQEPKEKPEPKKESGATDSALAAAISGMTEVIKASNRPKKIIRGADGKVEGVE